jgi:tRNA-specific 2-thiouridylase
MKKGGRKIFVGISGGVDSSVVAYLLKKQGYDVHGIFVKTWSPDWLPCTWIDEKRDAMRVCASLNIPFHFLDAEEEYKKEVADYMIAEYKAGRTPNPDVLCNRVIKFGVMWEYAKNHGAQAIATGHYARTDSEHLMKGADTSKDQSYFLWMIQKKELGHIMFPIGHLQKNEVRKIAEKAKLFTSEKKDSQGICFLGDVDMREFLSHYIEQKNGPVIDTVGNVLGEHDGIWFYTLGERHGFRISKQSTDQKPYYIVEKRLDDNILVVSHTPKVQIKNKKQLVTLRDTSWIEMKKGKLEAQVRYHGEFIKAKLLDENNIELSYQGVIALGQSLVLYQDDNLLGGGVIDCIS